MAKFLLRVEGQNLGSFVDDTQDLSTIRGGSLALLNSIDDLRDAVKLRCGVELAAISTGASIGLWSFDVATEQAAQSVADGVAQILRTGHKGADVFGVTPHATFAVVVVPATDDYSEAAETAKAIARRRQLSSAACIYPAIESSPRSVCPIDLMRPSSDGQMFYKSERPSLSASVYARRKYGLSAKQKFYHQKMSGLPIIERLAPEQATHPFALQLNSISERQTAMLRLRPSLQDKIAIVYMDGNGFGALQRRFVADNTPSDQMTRQVEFDNFLLSRRRELLSDLLALVLDRGCRGAPSKEEADLRRNELSNAATEVIRFEMLLWGGDEQMFVLPARVGWAALSRIVSATSKWSLELSDGPRALHHAIGLAYCHHDAPIGRVETLAKRLAEHAKSLSIDPGMLAPARGRDATLVMPIVLESFDHIGDDLETFLDRSSRPELKNRGAERDAAFVLRATEVDVLQKAALDLASIDFPRRRLKLLAQAIHWPGRHARETFEAIFARAQNEVHGCEPILNGLVSGFGGEDHSRKRALLFLEQLWDYLLPADTPLAQGKGAKS